VRHETLRTQKIVDLLAETRETKKSDPDDAKVFAVDFQEMTRGRVGASFPAEFLYPKYQEKRYLDIGVFLFLSRQGKR
jgi:hypothetical protein